MSFRERACLCIVFGTERLKLFKHTYYYLAPFLATKKLGTSGSKHLTAALYPPTSMLIIMAVLSFPTSDTGTTRKSLRAFPPRPS